MALSAFVAIVLFSGTLEPLHNFGPPPRILIGAGAHLPPPASGCRRGRRQAYAAAAELPSVLPRHVRPCGELRAWAAPPGGVTLYKYWTTLNKFNGINHYCSFTLFARCLVICITCYKIDWNTKNATYIRHSYK